MSITEDRNFYRQCTNAKLLELADENPTPELAVVLAERLEVSDGYWPQRHEDADCREPEQARY